MDSVVHFEIPATDVERAKTFYAKTFGWEIQSIPDMGYHLLTTTPLGDNQRPKEPGAINGGMLERQDFYQSPVMVIAVEEINAAVERVKGAGGDILREPMQVGDFGIAAYFKDPEGNVLGLFQPL